MLTWAAFFADRRRTDGGLHEETGSHSVRTGSGHRRRRRHRRRIARRSDWSGQGSKGQGQGREGRRAFDRGAGEAESHPPRRSQGGHLRLGHVVDRGAREGERRDRGAIPGTDREIVEGGSRQAATNPGRAGQGSHRGQEQLHEDSKARSPVGTCRSSARNSRRTTARP